MMRFVSIVVLFVVAGAVQAAEGPYRPAWASITPKRVIALKNTAGEALVKAVAGLKPGDQLVLAAGTYSVDRLWDIVATGTAEAPIWITAEDGADDKGGVIITRRDGKQNVINIGGGRAVQYLCLRGVEITGGSHGLRLHHCSNVWVDHCHLHHTGGVCLSANSAETHHLYLTDNHIHHGGGHAEGMYLGSHDGKLMMSESVIARNHIHDCRGEQGDGIEVKQGSWGNLIAENDVHDTNYPCITVYGTGWKPPNVIERNLCRRSSDNGMQVTGDAIVRNNVIIGAAASAFASTDNEDKTKNLQVIHNTIINTGIAFKAGSWNRREGLVLANNVLYSRDSDAIRFPAGAEGVVLSGNITLGAGPRTGAHRGRGLDDFQNLAWDGARYDAKPTAEAPFDQADPKYLLDIDFAGTKRTTLTSGALAR